MDARSYRITALVILVVLILSCVWIYIHRVYYFNPLTFRQDAVTPSPWKEYKRPMQVGFLSFNLHGTDYRYETTDSATVMYVISQLKSGKETSNYTIQQDSLKSGDIYLRNPVTGELYFDGMIFGNEIVEQFNGKYVAIHMNKGLQQLNQKELAYAQKHGSQ